MGRPYLSPYESDIVSLNPHEPSNEMLIIQANADMNSNRALRRKVGLMMVTLQWSP